MKPSTVETEARTMGFSVEASALLGRFDTILRQKAMPRRARRVRRCRRCSCTDQDCRQCIERTGSPCHWVEPDLCSACAPAPISPAARRALQSISTQWQKAPHWIRGSHLAVLIRHNHIEHRWPFDLHARLLGGGSYPWLSEGEIRRIVDLAR